LLSYRRANWQRNCATVALLSNKRPTSCTHVKLQLEGTDRMHLNVYCCYGSIVNKASCVFFASAGDSHRFVSGLHRVTEVSYRCAQQRRRKDRSICVTNSAAPNQHANATHKNRHINSPHMWIHLESKYSEAATLCPDPHDTSVLHRRHLHLDNGVDVGAPCSRSVPACRVAGKVRRFL
jgi:hypothetical protein